METKKILVSACLLGTPCKYSGGSNRNPKVIETIEKAGLEAVPICPEVLGGLPTPRVPAEIRGERVMTKDGRDVTEEFLQGAKLALKTAKENGCSTAILKERSPSCGCGRIYDGSFHGTLTSGDGITARMLRAAGIRILGEGNVSDLSD